MKICDITNESHNLEVMRKLDDFGKQHGLSLLQKAYEKARKSGGNSSFRDSSYLMAVMQRWVEEGSKAETSSVDAL